ncbi:MAG: hypothetical protein PVTTEEND_001666 [Candidatus Fervidibacter sp.]
MVSDFTTRQGTQRRWLAGFKPCQWTIPLTAGQINLSCILLDGAIRAAPITCSPTAAPNGCLCCKCSSKTGSLNRALFRRPASEVSLVPSPSGCPASPSPCYPKTKMSAWICRGSLTAVTRQGDTPWTLTTRSRHLCP